MKTLQEVKTLLKACQSREDWDRACEAIKADGGYPDFWWSDIIQSGLAQSIMNRWSGTTEIQYQSLPEVAGSVGPEQGTPAPGLDRTSVDEE